MDATRMTRNCNPRLRRSRHFCLVVSAEILAARKASTCAWLAVSFVLVGLKLAAADPPAPVILVSVDTLRADHLGAYGYHGIRTPNLDSFAEHGTLFAQAGAQVPLTLPSHASLFTSTYPIQNGIEENAEPVPPGAVTLASVLQSHGYRTAAFVSSVFLEQRMGLNQGFDTYDSPFDYTALSPLSGSMFLGTQRNAPGAGRDRRVGALTVRAAVQWLNANRNQPVFVFLHLYDLHRPYQIPAGFKPSPGVTGYDALIEYVDRVLGSFRKTLVETGWWDRSLVVLLSDHGEGLGEHGEATHGYFVYESTLRTPLIIHWPRSTTRPARFEQPVGLIDVAPTILDFLQVPVPPSFEGRSLLDAKSDRPVYAESLHSHDSFGWAPLRSVRSGAYKFIEAPRPELYDLQNDPKELHNLFAAHPGRARELRVQLSKLLTKSQSSRSSQSTSVTPQTRALLASLGYLGPGPVANLGNTGPDPKDRLPEFQMYEKAMVLLSDGRIAQAVATLGRILAIDPHNTLVRRDLGACYLEIHDYAKAREALEQVVSVAPEDYMTQYELGVTYARLDLAAQAREHLRAACRLAPDAAQSRHELEAVEKSLSR